MKQIIGKQLNDCHIYQLSVIISYLYQSCQYIETKNNDLNQCILIYLMRYLILK